MKCFQSGAFAVSITGSKGHSVALDEAHEMCVNKDMKTAIVRPTKAYLQKHYTFFEIQNCNTQSSDQASLSTPKGYQIV